MKRIILIGLAIVFLASVSFSQVWYPANQKTVGWDAVATLDDGSPIPAGETVRYQIYIVKEGQSKDTKINLGNTVNTQFLVTLPAEGKWFVGVQSERLDATGVLITQSQIVWSEDPAYCQNGETFGISFFRLPSQPKNLKPL